MSKLDLVSIEGKDLLPNVISALVDAFRAQTSRFPDALIITEQQAKDHFIANNEVMTNFRGIPLELSVKANETNTVIKTVDGLLAGMHVARVQNVVDVYAMLENMKVKLEAKNV